MWHNPPTKPRAHSRDKEVAAGSHLVGYNPQNSLLAGVLVGYNPQRQLQPSDLVGYNPKVGPRADTLVGYNPQARH